MWELGLDVPLYTRTGWPVLISPMPFGEIAAFFGAYANDLYNELTREIWLKRSAGSPAAGNALMLSLGSVEIVPIYQIQ